MKLADGGIFVRSKSNEKSQLELLPGFELYFLVLFPNSTLITVNDLYAFQAKARIDTIATNAYWFETVYPFVSTTV